MPNEQPQSGEPKKIFLVIHGHFYQPPRENPWTQTIPCQESAQPYHDWNERITVECYKPNTRSRALDGQGKILHLVNNFASMNFNLGPTLFSWLEQAYPDTYQRILAADRISLAANQGHGNAIAQVYNHVILPLANDRDKITQMIWGQREFQHRFGRAAESIWLAETAINQATVACLIAQGIKYVILSPTQAQQVRPIGAAEWIDVSHNEIDTTQPYRLFAPDAPETYLDVFFFDVALSTDISFNHLLRDANAFAHRIAELAAKATAPSVLIHVATDGEVYGHHEPFGDMCLAAAITAQFPALNVELTNYGRYLELFPPTQEVALKPGGEDDEGTAWSCAHGVGRWARDCGCNISHQPGWQQHWRAPLRQGFDVLRDALAELFERLGGALLRDPWEARNDYITCLLDPAEQTINAFLAKHALQPLTAAEESLVLRLLEAEKYALFTYTSCAWFFDDVSGLEVTQNMCYAARAVQLLEGLETGELEARMLAEFAEAKSNLPQFGDGQALYLNYVKPDVYTPERAANQFLLENLINSQYADAQHPDHAVPPAPDTSWQEARHIHIYRLQCAEYFPPPAATALGLAFHRGLLHVKETTTRQEWRFLFTVFLKEGIHPLSYLQRLTDDHLRQFEAAVAGAAAEPESFFAQRGFTAYSLTDIYAEDRQRLFWKMIQHHVDRAGEQIRNIYADTLELLDYLTLMNFQVPAQLRATVEFALAHQLLIEMEKLSPPDNGLHSPAFLSAELEKILRLSQTHHLHLDTTLLQNCMRVAVTKYLAHVSRQIVAFEQTWTVDADLTRLSHFLALLQETARLIEKAAALGVTLDKTDVQNMTADLLEKMIPRYLATFQAALQMTALPERDLPAPQVFSRFFTEYKCLRECMKLAQRLDFNVERYRDLLISAELTMTANDESVSDS